MAVTPRKLYHGAVAAVPGVVYTVPVGLSIVLRHLLVVGSGGAANITVSVAGQPIFGTEPVAANRRLEQWLMEAMAAGDTITAGASVGGALVLLAEGFSY